MSAVVHERARRLALASRVEGVSEHDGLWLQGHLAQCESCAGFALRLGEGLQAVRLTDVRVDPWLLALTQRRLRARARAQQGDGWGLLAATALGFALASAAAFGLWLAVQGLGGIAGEAFAVRLSLAVALWFSPASVLALAAALLRPRLSGAAAVAFSEVRP